ncbi:MAG: extracellular solute-binding protein [Acutalibacteraceae bacterium]
MRGILYKAFSVFLILSLLAAVPCAAQKNDITADSDTADLSDESYFYGYEKISDTKILENDIELLAKDAVTDGGELKTVYEKAAIVLDSTNEWCEWCFSVSEPVSFNISMEYLPDLNSTSSISVSISIDGRSPFSEAGNLTLSRKWQSVLNEGDEPFERDSKGNEVRPEQVQVADWLIATFENSQGLYDEPYLFSVSGGTHKIRITVAETSVSLSKITLGVSRAPSYDEYIEACGGQTASGDEITYLQAELAESTTSASLYPTYDKLNAATVPSDPCHTRLNTIGGSNWADQGDSISWKVNIKEAGLYKIAFRARQNVNSGLISYRKILINGELPFEEASAIPFSYSQNWKMFTLGNGEREYYLYLKPGDTLTMVSTTGETAKVLRNIQSSISDLNAIYRSVLAITSANPDPYQDYKLEEKIEGIDTSLKEIHNRLSETYEELCEIIGSDGSLASSIKVSYDSVERFAKAPYKISEELSSFKGILESLGSIVISLSEQPLELDYIAFLAEDARVPNANADFASSFMFTLKQFLYSFTDDYKQISSNLGYSKEISVWVSTGRDQAQMISQLIDSDFTEKYNIGVSLNMVDTGSTLIRAALAGKGPDIALMIAQKTPVELAARGALIELSDYITDDIFNSFHKSSWTPFYYDGGIYALPETQNFNVLFYRTDVFSQLGISVPDTWEDFYDTMAKIQSNNLAVGMLEINSASMGISASINIFNALLTQRGGMYYTDDLSRTQFDTEIAYEAFTQWCRFYTDYSLDRQYDFYSRFRTGEMPLAFGSLSSYGQIIEAAPEIRGLWTIAEIPGMPDGEGKINRSQNSDLTGCIMLKAAQEHDVVDEGIQFLKWWVSAETQQSYARDLEVAMGVAGRYYSANTEAFSKIDWTSGEYKVVSNQMESLINQPTVVGDYAVTRSLTSALRDVISGSNRPRRSLLLYNSDINEEIARKRKEFCIDE